jgi:hypothetical protein
VCRNSAAAQETVILANQRTDLEKKIMAVRIRAKLVLDVFTPQSDYPSIERFATIAICSCCGIDMDHLSFDGVESSFKDRKTTLCFQLVCESLVDAWGMISRIRLEMSSSDSQLHTLPRTRKVFSGAMIQIADPRESLDSPFKSRYTSKSPLDLQYGASLPNRGHPPESAIRISLIPDEQGVRTHKHLSLPNNSTHDPISVVFVNAGSGQDVQDVDRSVVIQVAQEVDESLLDDDGDEFDFFIDTSVIDALLDAPRPHIPESLIQLHTQLAT